MKTLNKTSLLLHNKKFELSASLICANMLNLEEDIKLLEKGGIDSLEVDVMDGMFVPRIGLPPETVKAVRSVTKLPISVHMMIQDPERYAKVFTESGTDTLIFHAESTVHIHRTLKKIRGYGVKVGIALNPATPLTTLEYILDDIDLVMLMAINPGILGHKLIPAILKKIADLKIMLRKHLNIKIQVDGGVTFESAAEMIKLGADILVCGSSTIFRSGKRIDRNIVRLRNEITDNLKDY